MSTARFLTALLVLSLPGLPPGPAGPRASEAPPPGENLAKQSLQWFEKVEPGQSVRVSNPTGNVYARFGGYEGKVEILATIQKLDPDLPELEVDRASSATGLDVTVRYRQDEGESDPLGGTGTLDTLDRVDLVLFVPLGAALDVETRDGLIEVKGIKSDLTAATIKGDLKISKVEGRVRATSERGSISATLESEVTQQAQTLTTRTGNIEVYIWEDANLEAKLATSGRIATDFSMEIEHRRFEEPGKHATATVGQGGPPLTLFSKRGDLSLLRLPRHYRSED